MSAPHLPSQTCVLKTHQLWQTLRFTILILVIAIPASMAMALITVVWLLPTTIPDSVNSIIGRRAGQEKEVKIDSLVLAAARQKIWTVYDKRQKVEINFYSESAKVGSAVVLSSNGWAVMYVPGYAPGAEKNWEALDYQGISYTVEKTAVDPVAKLLYLKFTGRGFRVIQFADWSTESELDPVWSVDGVSRQGLKLDRSMAYLKGLVHSVWQPPNPASFSEAVPGGSVIINRDGDLVGIANNSNGLAYGWLVEAQMNKILDSGTVEYLAVPWKGYFVHGIIEENSATKKISGFYVSDAVSKPALSPIINGDILVKVDGRAFDEENLAQAILSAPMEFPVTIVRDGKEMELIVKKISMISKLS